MNIVFISHGSTLEGAERSLIEAVKGLSAQGEEVHVVVPSQGKLTQALDGIASSIHILFHPWWVNERKSTSNPVKRFYEYAKSIFKLVLLLRKLKPHLVVTNTIVIPCGAVASKLLGISHIWYIREFLEEDHGWTFEFGKAFSLSFIDWASNQIIVNSHTVYKKFAENIAHSKIKVIYNAVDISRKINEDKVIKREEGVFYVALVGRKAPGKGQIDAIEAVSILVKKGLDIRLWLIGGEFDDSYVEILRESVRNLGICDKVEFISLVDNPFSYLKIADIALVCSRSEAFGRVTIEAMKLGKAVVGASSGSTPELIKDNWNGLLYEVNNPQSLAEKIEVLYQDKFLKTCLELNAYKWANEKFSINKYTSDMMGIFSSLHKSV